MKEKNAVSIEDMHYLHGSSDASVAYLIYSYFQKKKPSVLISSPEKLHNIARYIEIFDNYNMVQSVFFPAIEHYGQDMRLFQAKTIESLHAVVSREPYIIFLPYTQLFSLFPSPSLFQSFGIELHTGLEIGYMELLSRLTSYGYRTTSMVHHCTEVAHRGDIIDIYPPDVYYRTQKGIREALPLRIEFFGDVIEDMRIFNKDSQRFIQKIEKHTLYPLLFGNISSPKEQRIYQEQLPEQYAHSIQRIHDAHLDTAPSYYYQETKHSIIDFLPQDALYIRSDDMLCEEREKETYAILTTCYEKYAHTHSIDIDIASLYNKNINIEEYSDILIEKLSTKKESKQLEEKQLYTFQDICISPKAAEKPWNTLIQTLHTWKKEYKQIILVFKTLRNRDAFISLAKEAGINGFQEYRYNKDGIFFCVGECAQGSILSYASVIILPESLLYPNYRAKKGAKKAFKGLQQYNTLQEGMHIIHKEYGIGIYRGLHRISIGDYENDYIFLEYANNDKVYIPVYQIGIIQIYSSNDEQVFLDSLGGNAWKNSIARAKKAIEAIAHDLIAMYAARSCAKKYRYGEYSELYKEFELAFAFEETPDQAQAIEDVLEDMDKEQPMDRLVCGDVGFGKTEVAIRACVRAALDGRQVAFLCPTTILAEQHYHTIQQRVAMLPLRVALLNRFIPKKEQEKIKRELAKGEIDIIIGTHRLLSKDIEIPNLSLLILDEEHRFGVRHKEKLKLLKNSIDTLTLTATPIPRTLQLSMSGIRELSVIETAPLERKAVEMHLCEEGDIQIQEALERELAREGQVFWVYNRVHSIEERKRHIQRLCPTARIAYVHGQMNEHALEENMRAFWNGEIDILLATTIIESGLDFPLANTIIIDSAHTFGLNQLYQLRGRVGRGDRQGYAYFVIPHKKALTEVAMDRLNAILSLDYLGAGFQIAMEDLRIRGAGNILGEAQSGHIERIGVELYLEMLEEEVDKLRVHQNIEKKEKAHNVELQLSIPTYIPEEYIPQANERLYYYKKISLVASQEEEDDICSELKDRFGAIPSQIYVLFATLHLQRILSKVGVAKATVSEKAVVLQWKEGQTSIAPQNIMNWVEQNKAYLSILPPASVECSLRGDVAQALRQCITIVNSLVQII